MFYQHEEAQPKIKNSCKLEKGSTLTLEETCDVLANKKAFIRHQTIIMMSDEGLDNG